MILATDVHYTQSTAMAAGVLFKHWNALEPEREYTCGIQNIEPYEPGSFYKRELPCILTLIKKHNLSVNCIVVDGYVYLDDDLRAGLGKYLYDALDGVVSVIGVAKTPFEGINDKHKILRGDSKTPLYITSTGDLAEAKSSIVSMHGDFRIPTLLKRADTLCRTGAG